MSDVIVKLKAEINELQERLARSIEPTYIKVSARHIEAFEGDELMVFDGKCFGVYTGQRTVRLPAPVMITSSEPTPRTRSRRDYTSRRALYDKILNLLREHPDRTMSVNELSEATDSQHNNLAYYIKQLESQHLVKATKVPKSGSTRAKTMIRLLDSRALPKPKIPKKERITAILGDVYPDGLLVSDLAIKMGMPGKQIHAIMTGMEDRIRKEHVPHGKQYKLKLFLASHALAAAA